MSCVITKLFHFFFSFFEKKAFGGCSFLEASRYEEVLDKFCTFHHYI